MFMLQALTLQWTTDRLFYKHYCWFIIITQFLVLVYCMMKIQSIVRYINYTQSISTKFVNFK